jgi:hypothetical protein
MFTDCILQDGTVAQKWYCEWNHPQPANGIHHIAEVGGVELHTCDVAFDPKRCGGRITVVRAPVG